MCDPLKRPQNGKNKLPQVVLRPPNAQDGGIERRGGREEAAEVVAMGLAVGNICCSSRRSRFGF